MFSYPSWAPPAGTGITDLTVGPRWAAVSLPAQHSARANEFHPSGPHILDRAAGRATWLIPPRNATRWHWRRIERYLDFHNEGTVLALPQADRRAEHGDIHWAIPGKWAQNYVGAPEEVAGVLAVVTLEYGPAAPHCEMCPDPVWPEARVTAAIPLSQGGPFARVVHRACAVRHRLQVLEDR